MLIDFDFSLIFSELCLIVMACFILILGMFKKLNITTLKSLSILALVVALVTKLTLTYSTSFFSLFVFDEVAKYSSILIILCAIYFLLVNIDSCELEFYSVFLMMIASFCFMVSSNNLILIFVGLEGSSLALYSLIAFKKNAIDAAIRYFNYGMLACAFFAFGSACYYFDNVSLELHQINAFSLASVLAFAMIFSAVLFKLSIFPFHLWLKDVYMFANSSLAGFISIVPKIAMMSVASRFVLAYDGVVNLSNFIMIIAGISMIYASVLALNQTNAKQMLVYSSISHSSFAFCALALGYNTFVPFIYYFASFAFVNMALFAFLSIFKESDYSRFNGLFKKYPLFAMFAIILLLNLAALPPFGVFFAKVEMINIALQTSLCVAIAMALSSFIMLFAYLRFIKAMFKDAECGFIYFTKGQKIAFILAIIASFGASFIIDYLR